MQGAHPASLPPPTSVAPAPFHAPGRIWQAHPFQEQGAAAQPFVHLSGPAAASPLSCLLQLVAFELLQPGGDRLPPSAAQVAEAGFTAPSYLLAQAHHMQCLASTCCTAKTLHAGYAGDSGQGMHQ